QIFTISANSRWQPLRIQHDPDKPHIVIYGDNQRQKTEESCKTPLESDSHGHKDTQNGAHDEIQPSLKDLFDTCIQLYQHLEKTAGNEIEPFRQAAANTRYYHSMLMEEIEMLHTAGINTQADGKGLKQMLEEVCALEQQVPQWTYQVTCGSMIYEASYQWDFSTSLFFIVLPSDLDSWDELNPSTHRFRLYYMCDNWDHANALDDMPQHMHLSNHPGYSLKRQKEFFHIYGDYVLRVLQMIKHGYSGGPQEIPPLDPLKFLWNCDPDIIGSHVTNEMPDLSSRGPSLTFKNPPHPNGQQNLLWIGPKVL
ncbi:hypothetical protein BG000_008930, partial [Podila horticola]